MKNLKKLFLFTAMGGVAAGGAGLLRQSRERRRSLARRVNQVTQAAIKSLAVPAESRYVRVGDVRLHVVVAGPPDGPLALLLHGFPECWYSWRRQIPALVGAGYRVVVPDQRGYNLSDKPPGVHNYRLDQLTADAAGLLRAFDRERAVVVGHDWGGVVAWRLAMDYPQAVSRLIVMNAPHPVAYAREIKRSWEQRLKSWYALAFQIPWLPETVLSLSPPASAHLFFRRTAVRADAFSDADLEVMATALAQPGALQTMIHWYRAAVRHPPARRTQVVETSTLLIWAEDDVALGLPLTYGLEKWVPDLRVRYVPNCGHWVQNEAPDVVNAKMLAFLRP